MIRRPPISTRTDTLFPYTTLFRSEWLNVPDSKSGVRENVPGVRIPPSPPQNKRADSMSAFLLCRIEKREGFEAAAAAGPVGESLPLRHKIQEPTKCRLFCGFIKLADDKNNRPNEVPLFSSGHRMTMSAVI